MRWNLVLAPLVAVAAIVVLASTSQVHSSQPDRPKASGEYRVLEPLESGGLTLFPVVRKDIPGAAAKWDYITLDEGLRSGDVVVTEAGKIGGMIRPHRGYVRPVESFRGDQVNTLVLVNNSQKPLMLLAGEIVTGGKQDRVIAKDRVVPPESDPIDLSVFCIEPGRWTEASGKFDASNRDIINSFMVQPKVRSQAMVAQDQQQVWNSVHKSIATASENVSVSGAAPSLDSSSYAKAMNNELINKQVDKAAGPLIRSRDEILKKLRDEHAVGVVVAVHGEIVWADLFATPEMLASYWTKLVRSYAAESFDNMRVGKAASVADAQAFLDQPVKGTETSVGESGVYSYREVRAEKQSAFYLKVFAGAGDFYAHISRVAEEGTKGKPIPAMYREPWSN